MRVTQSMLSSNMMKNLSSSLARLDELNTQVATQKKFNKPSDDPVAAMKGIVYRRSLQETEQFERNFGEAYNWVEGADAALDKSKQALDRVRELVVQASNDTYGTEERKAMKAEIEQLKQHVIEIANTKYSDKYLFNGTDTINAPIKLDDTGNIAEVSGNTGKVELELSKGVYVQVNINPAKAFPAGLFSTIDDVLAKLDDGSGGSDMTKLLDDLDKHITANSTARAEVGARFQRIELMEARNAEQAIMATRIMSENEDIDFEKAVTELTVQESVHKAALSIGARIIQPTLMDFLR